MDGQVRSLSMALKQANVQTREIDYINAHATSTAVGDGSEARAIFQVFGGDVPVSSTKSMTGHECWMAGASEIVYSILMMQNDFVAPNINFENPDEDSALINVIAETKTQQIDCFLSNSFGFGGTNSTLIVRKFSLKQRFRSNTILLFHFKALIMDTVAGALQPSQWLGMYGDYLYSVAFFKTGSKEIAEDLVQETFFPPSKRRILLKPKAPRRPG